MISLPVFILASLRKKNPKVTAGLKWPPQNGAPITIAKYNERLIKMSWNGLGIFRLRGGTYWLQVMPKARINVPIT